MWVSYAPCSSASGSMRGSTGGRLGSAGTGARVGLFALLVASVGACGSDGTGPGGVQVSGTWQGTTQLATAYSTTLTLQQSGNTIGGTIVIAGLLDRPFVGTLPSGTRAINWTAVDGCEEWSGTLTVDSGGSQMTGPVLNDLSNCPAGSDSNGTISLTRQ